MDAAERKTWFRLIKVAVIAAVLLGAAIGEYALHENYSFKKSPHLDYEKSYVRCTVDQSVHTFKSLAIAGRVNPNGTAVLDTYDEMFARRACDGGTFDEHFELANPPSLLGYLWSALGALVVARMAYALLLSILRYVAIGKFSER